MKKYILFFLVTQFFVLQSFSQSWRRMSGWGNELTGIHWVNDDVGYISGDQIILKTIDGGLSWFEQESPVDGKMLALDFFNNDMGLIVGEGGLVFRTINGGDQWDLVSIGHSEDLNSVQYLTENKVYIVGDAGTVFLSDDSGQTWTFQNIGFTADLNAMHFYNLDTGYLATSDAKVLRTVDSGNNWTQINTPVSNPLNDIVFVNDTTGYIVGDAGTILKSIDAGLSWTFIQSGTEFNYNRVDFHDTNPNVGLVAGESGVVLYTNNAGLTFSQRTSRTDQNILGLSYKLATNNVYAVANSGVLISSANSGASWSLRMSGRNNDFTATQFVTDLRGYIVGQEALILSTTNGGSSFADRSRPLSIPFNNLEFVSASFGYVVGDNGTILITTNSGGGWTALNPNTEKNLYGIHFFDANNGYIVGENGYIAKTDNRGVNWTTIAEGALPINFRDIDFFDQDIGLIIGDQGNIYRTDGADNWQKVSLGASEDFTALKILDELTVLVVGKSGALYKSEDKGLSWKKISLTYSQDFSGIDFLDESVGFIAGEKGLIIQTMDQGETWEQTLTSTYQDFTDISFGDLNTGYAVGENGIFYQYSCLVPLEPSAIFGEEDICLSQQIYTIQDEVGAGVTYEWRVDGGTILEGQGSNRVVVQWDTPGRNAVLVRGQNICGNGPTTGLEVLVSEEPAQVSNIIGDGIACLGVTQPFEVDSIPGTSYIWEVSGGIIQEGQGTAHIAVEWESEGNQSIRVFPRNTCGEAAVFEKAISVSQAPAQPGSITGPIKVGLKEEVYEVPLVEGVNYQWSTDGGRIVEGQGTNQVLVSWEVEGDFTLNVVPMNACESGPSQSLDVNIDLITSIEKEVENGRINIYPNPSSGDIHIGLSGLPQVVEISILDPMGQNIRKITPDYGIYEFDIQNLPKGMLLIMVKTRQGKTVEKLWIK
ncbi:YCF48-related protein [Echinicola shivajiensis]|uniref:YCF48-related protein n=1 Tax=Echinicola shivajiensis TaxID=1035916 RepID=UPI001BFC9C8B|nr:YCF48-related protein [Echinicola shivajiensis]